VRDWHEVNDVRCIVGNIDVGIGLFTFKRECHEKNSFLEGFRNDVSTFCLSTDSFHNIWLPFCVENSK
jgi:hypothetical protein